MKNFFLLVAVCLGWVAATAQYNKSNLTLQADETATKFTLKNMRIYPVLAQATFVNAQQDVGKYTSLGDALKQKKLVITEDKDGQVNKLYAENVSQDTIMILGGEVISGGKQDRMIANDFILPPKSGKKDLSVFCVEHGRWHYKEPESISGSGDANDKTMYMFSCSPGIASTKVRKAGNVEKNQSSVWNNVEEVTGKNNAGSSTGAYTALDSNVNYKKQLVEYTPFFKKILAANPSTIGMVVVTGDSVLGCELFATHELLMQHADDIINSYATEAMTNGSKVTISNSKVQSYVNKLLADETKQERLIKENGTELKDRNRKLHIAFY